MNKVISLIACISIAVFAQNQQTQPPPPQQGQYQYPPQQPPPGQYQYPPQQPPPGQYQYPPPQQQAQPPQPTPQQPPQGQYQYPPQGQYQYPPQGQYQYPPQQQTQPPQPTPQQQPTQQMPPPQQQPPPPAATAPTPPQTPAPPAAAIPQPTPQPPPTQQPPQYQYPPQGQYQYPPQEQYQYPPQQGQYQYPPQEQYQYPPQGQYPYPPQGQYQQYPPPPQYGANTEQPAKQESARGMQFGVRAVFAMNSISTGNSKKDDYINMGMGFGAGAVANFPITSIIAFSSEVNFLYRTLYKISESEGGGSYEEYVSEYAISIPLMLQIMPITGVPIHFAGGAQIDLPFKTIEYKEQSGGGRSQSSDKAIDDRRTFDFGIAVGVGYRILPSLEVDLRAVMGLTPLTTDSDDKSSYKQLGIGVNYFF